MRADWVNKPIASPPPPPPPHIMSFTFSIIIDLTSFYFFPCSHLQVELLLPPRTPSHPNLSPLFQPVFTKTSKRNWKISYLSLSAWTTSMQLCRRSVIKYILKQWILRKSSPMKTRNYEQTLKFTF